MAKQTDPAQQLADADTQRKRIAASLSILTLNANTSAERRRATEEAWDRCEGDTLIGTATAAAIATTRERRDAAIVAHQKAAALLREAEHQLVVLDDLIARLRPQVYVIRVAHYYMTHVQLAQRLSDGLKALLPINDALHANYQAAMAEFPHTVIRGGGSRGYPVAAGLMDLSWRELRDNPQAIDRGRLGHWLRLVDELIRNAEIVAPTR